LVEEKTGRPNIHSCRVRAWSCASGSRQNLCDNTSVAPRIRRAIPLPKNNVSCQAPSGARGYIYYLIIKKRKGEGEEEEEEEKEKKGRKKNEEKEKEKEKRR
jgi:hypothetical protein